MSASDDELGKENILKGLLYGLLLSAILWAAIVMVGLLIFNAINADATATRTIDDVSDGGGALVTPNVADARAGGTSTWSVQIQPVEADGP